MIGRSLRGRETMVELTFCCLASVCSGKPQLGRLGPLHDLVTYVYIIRETINGNGGGI